jgi:hypothetical protein
VAALKTAFLPRHMAMFAIFPGATTGDQCVTRVSL